MRRAIPKASTAQTLLFLLIVVVLIIVAWIAVAHLVSSDKVNTTQNGPGPLHVPQHQQTSPDRVKQSAPANGDTAPSSTGTGPGSNNSLLH